MLEKSLKEHKINMSYALELGVRKLLGMQMELEPGVSVDEIATIINKKNKQVNILQELLLKAEDELKNVR